MTLPDFSTFRSQALSRGFQEVLERRWEPGTVTGEHTHPFEADALVVQGEMWLTVNGATDHLRPGGRFNIAAGTPHAEVYGPEGAIYWVARR